MGHRDLELIAQPVVKRISTRRFFRRLVSLSFFATGSASPRPLVTKAMVAGSSGRSLAAAYLGV